jgi:HlyD family secretion protein
MASASRWRLGVVLLSLLALGGFAAYLVMRGPAVAVVQVQRGTVTETVVASGRVLAPAEIELDALVNTTVREVFVKEGDWVEVGQLLATLDDEELVAALGQAEAALGQAKAGRFELSVLSEPAARNNLREARATLASAKRTLAQTKQLYESSFGTLAEYEDAQTAHVVATANVEAARLQLAATTEGGSQTALSSASIAVATAQVERAKAQLARTRITSPVAGVVLARHVEPGDSVVTGSELFELARTGATRLVIEPDERNLARLALGQPALASAEAFPDQPFAAEVLYIAPSVDAQRGTIEVQLAVAEPPAFLRPHMTISVEVEVGEHADTLVIPRRAVRGLAGAAPHVLVIESGRVGELPIELGIRGDEQVEVLGGLPDDAWVILDETTPLALGDRVRPRFDSPGQE